METKVIWYVACLSEDRNLFLSSHGFWKNTTTDITEARMFSTQQLCQEFISDIEESFSYSPREIVVTYTY